MSLTFSKQETPPIAKCVYPHDKKKKSKLVYISEDDNGPNEMVAESDSSFFPLPYILNNQRDALFISAPSGSGKSVFAGQYIQELQKHKEFKNLPVYLFTSNFEEKQTKQGISIETDDPAYKNIKNLKVINIYHPNLVKLQINELSNSILLFDDFDMISNKNILSYLRNLLKQALEVGRKKTISVVAIVHDTLQGNHTKSMIFEANSVVIYPKYNVRTAKQFAKNYLGWSKDQLDDIKNYKGRWMFVRKSVPLYKITEDKIELL